MQRTADEYKPTNYRPGFAHLFSFLFSAFPFLLAPRSYPHSFHYYTEQLSTHAAFVNRSIKDIYGVQFTDLEFMFLRLLIILHDLYVTLVSVLNIVNGNERV